MLELFWVLVGFVLAIAWDKYKDWCRFETVTRWIYEELQEAKNSLESRFAKLPDAVKEKVKIAQEGGKAKTDLWELLIRSGLPAIDVRMPYGTHAWQTFIASGYASKLEHEDYKTLSEAYTTLEGSNFVAGSAPFLLVASSSPVFDEPTRRAVFESLVTAPLFPVIFALPKLNAAQKRLEERNKSSSLRSFVSFVSK